MESRRLIHIWLKTQHHYGIAVLIWGEHMVTSGIDLNKSKNESTTDLFLEFYTLYLLFNIPFRM